MIVRTVGEGEDKKEFKSDIKMLVKLWNRIKKQTKKKNTPALIHEDMEMTTSIIRDILSPEVSEVTVDSRKEFKKILSRLEVMNKL